VPLVLAADAMTLEPAPKELVQSMLAKRKAK
jgi:hypothetical protein